MTEQTTQLGAAVDPRPSNFELAALIGGEPVTKLEVGSRYLVRTPSADGSVHVTEIDRLPANKYFDEAPARVCGTVGDFFDPASFVAYVASFKNAGTRLFADADHSNVLAVINGPANESSPAWGDHRVKLTLKPTPEWMHWASRDGKIAGQLEFAEHVEDGINDIVEPSGSAVLEMAQTLSGTVGVTYRSQQILADGQRQLLYSEDTTTTAGRSGELTVPKEIKLGLRPYRGAALYEVTARIRTRVNGGHMQVGYLLNRPQEVLDASFADATAALAQDLQVPVLNGQFGSYS